MSSYASEQGHWYDREGKPCYTIIGANGKERPTTLRDARKLNLVPSVTTIMRMANAPGLERWKISQAIMAALTLPKIEGESSDNYIDRILKDSQEQAKKAAERGTNIHAAIEGHYTGQKPPDEYMLHVIGATELIEKTCGITTWGVEKSFACKEGYGGKVDLYSDEWILDFKSKEFGENDKLQTWDEHAMQLAAYDSGLGGILDIRRGGIVYVSTTNPGLARFIKIPAEELNKGYSMFMALLTFWQAKTGYKP